MFICTTPERAIGRYFLFEIKNLCDLKAEKVARTVAYVHANGIIFRSFSTFVLTRKTQATGVKRLLQATSGYFSDHGKDRK
jgi:hypothetical protein